MNYRTVGDMAACVRSHVSRIPEDVDVVVGIPRSGMLPATLIALYVNVSLTDVDGYLENRVFKHGARRPRGLDREIEGTGRHILLVDDSAATGRQLRETHTKLVATAQSRGDRLTTLVIYGNPGENVGYDLSLEDVPFPRMFEWNVMHHPVLADCCVDIDGVLCRDPRPDENDDGVRYQAFLHDAEPLMIPAVPVGWLVTCRLEKYRGPTEDWLRRHNVRYGHLIMLDVPDMRTRQRGQFHGRFKADVYLKSGADLFIESDPDQAAEIAGFTGLPVLCIGTNRLLESTGIRILSRPSSVRQRVLYAVKRRLWKTSWLMKYYVALKKLGR